MHASCSCGLSCLLTAAADIMLVGCSSWVSYLMAAAMGYHTFWLQLWGTFVLGFNDTSTLVGHFVSSPREREKRDRRDS